MACRLKRHIEQDAPANLLFGFMSAYCGRRRKGDYRMFPPDDAIFQRSQTFFADPRYATCETCRRLFAAKKVRLRKGLVRK